MVNQYVVPGPFDLALTDEIAKARQRDLEWIRGVVDELIHTHIDGGVS